MRTIAYSTAVQYWCAYIYLSYGSITSWCRKCMKMSMDSCMNVNIVDFGFSRKGSPHPVAVTMTLCG
jgi:hypothetical protein